MKIGTCGFCESRSKYLIDFDAVEIQNTFYDFVDEEWLRNLRNELKDNFEIILKAIQIITHTNKSPTYRRFKSVYGNEENYGHFKKTKEVYDAMEKMIEYAKIVKSDKIVIQAPPDFHGTKQNVENISEFLESFSGKNIKICIEFRGEWDENTLLDIFKKFNIIHVVDPFKKKSLYGEFKYYRLHGKSNYSYSYNEDDLNYLKKILNENDYVMFNNTHMCENAKSFRKMVKNDI